MNELKSTNRTYRKKKTPFYKRPKNSNTNNNSKNNQDSINKSKKEANNKPLNSIKNKINTKAPNPVLTSRIKKLKNSLKEDTTKKNSHNNLGTIYKNNSFHKKISLNYKKKQKNNTSIRKKQNLNSDKKTIFTLYVENGQNMMQRNEILDSENKNIIITNPNDQKLILKNSNINDVNKTEIIKDKNKSPLNISVKNTSKKTIELTNSNKKSSKIKNYFNSAKQRKTKKIFFRNKINVFRNSKLKSEYENRLNLTNNTVQNTINNENKQSLKSIDKSSTSLVRNLTYVNLNTNHIPHYLQNTISTKNKVVIPIKKITKTKSNNNFKKILINKINYTDRNTINSINSNNKSKEKENKYFQSRNDNYNKINKTETYQKKEIFNIKDKSIEKKKISFIHHTPNQKSETSNISNENNNNNINNYLITKELGKGSYASVKLATHKITKIKYAMKIYPRKCLLDPQKRNTVNNEIEILKQLDHINIVKLYEVIYTDSHLYLVMEYINGVSLLEILKKEIYHYIPQKKALKIFIQILKAIIFCQSKNISHRDIKLENILIIKNDIVKIIDFGFAVKATKNEFQKLFCGTPSYMSPEIVNKQKYVAQYSDIWSMGVLLFSMLYGRFPFRAKEQDILFEKISNAVIIFPDDVEIDERLKLLFKKIFVVTPTQRPSLNEILNEIMIIDK